MPRFDRTGPSGQGAMTGRKLGKCNKKTEKPEATAQENDLPEEKGLGQGLGQGRGAGRGQGGGQGQRPRRGKATGNQ